MTIILCYYCVHTFGMVVTCGNNIRNSYNNNAVSIDSLLTGVSTILTGRVTCDSHGFVEFVYNIMFCCQYLLTSSQGDM